MNIDGCRKCHTFACKCEPKPAPPEVPAPDSTESMLSEERLAFHRDRCSPSHATPHATDYEKELVGHISAIEAENRRLLTVMREAWNMTSGGGIWAKLKAELDRSERYVRAREGGR